jgi:hypothetical protein
MTRVQSRSGAWFVILAGLLLLVPAIGHCQACVTAAQVTLSGSFRGANGTPASNYVMTLVPSQQGYISTCGVNLPIANTCGTSTDGSVVGIGNPLTATVNTTSGSGSLPSGVYYSVYEFYDAAGHVTLPSPETAQTLSVTGSLVVNPPSSGVPSLASGMKVFISTTSGAETLQGSTTGSGSFIQSTSLTSGASPSGTNTTLCQIIANDAIWPTGTGYNVSLTDSAGNPVPNYPMQWQLMGPGTTINLSNGLPYYHGVVYYPVPILAAPANHGTQSISGGLNFGGYNVLNVGKLGIGTATPGWGIDVEGSGLNAFINAAGGYLVNGNGGTSGQCLASDGTAYDTSVPCIGSLPTVYYQTVQSNGSAQTQRPALNFSPYFVITDSSSPTRTTVSPVTTGTEGQLVTAASAGTSGNCAQWDMDGGIAATSSPCFSGTVTQKNCLSVSCAGGSTYASGVTYTNLSSVPVMEEVAADYTSPGGGCVGQDFILNAYVNGLLVGHNSVNNSCIPTYTGASVTFLVPAGSTFSTVVLYDSGAAVITSWVELPI